MSSKLRATLKDGTPVSEDLAEQDILELLASGEATLDDHQREPPWILMEIFESRLDKVEMFGPETTEGASLAKVSDGLVVSGVRQLSVAGKPIGWCQTRDSVADAAGEVLGSDPSGQRNVWADLERIYRAYLKKGHHSFERHGTLSDEEMAERGFIPTRFSYLQVAPGWHRFYRRRKAVRVELATTVKVGLISRRIICCEDGSKGARVVPHGDFTPARNEEDNFYYCFTRDLPKAWFSTSGQLRKRRRAAAEWINKICLYYQSQGRYAAIKDLKTVAAEKFGLTENAINDAWRDFEHKASQRGNSPQSKKVYVKEIRELINR